MEKGKVPNTETDYGQMKAEDTGGRQWTVVRRLVLQLCVHEMQA